MSKPYVRKRASGGKPETFTCKCGEVVNDKRTFKRHWRESADHDQRVKV